MIVIKESNKKWTAYIVRFTLNYIYGRNPIGIFIQSFLPGILNITIRIFYEHLKKKINDIKVNYLCGNTPY